MCVPAAAEDVVLSMATRLALARDLPRLGCLDNREIHRHTSGQAGHRDGEDQQIRPHSVITRHVANKDDLLDEAVDVLFAGRWEPSAPKRRWEQWIIEAADRLRQFLVEQPAALHVYLRHPVVSPTAAERMDTCLAVLRAALDDARARRAFGAIQTYTIGFAALEAARETAAQRRDGTNEASDRARADRTRELANYTSPQQFRAGLRYLLAGIVA